MVYRFPRLALLFSVIIMFSACQEDIPVLGEGDGDRNYDSVFLWAITLNDYDTLYGFGQPWDSTFSWLYDSMYYRFPDVFYNIGMYDTTFPFSFYQKSHFLNVTPDTLPLAYLLEPEVWIPEFYKPFHVRLYDFELDTPSVDSTFIDSILFIVGPDPGGPEEFPRYVSGIGPNGTSVTISLFWR